MTEKHFDRAQQITELIYEDHNRVVDQLVWTDGEVGNRLKLAHVEAMLAVAEQQRIANLIQMVEYNTKQLRRAQVRESQEMDWWNADEKPTDEDLVALMAAPMYRPDRGETIGQVLERTAGYIEQVRAAIGETEEQR